MIEKPKWFKRSKEGVCEGSGDSLTAEWDFGLDLMFFDFSLVLVLDVDLDMDFDLGNGMEEGYRFGSEIEAGIVETLSLGGSRDDRMS